MNGESKAKHLRVANTNIGPPGYIERGLAAVAQAFKDHIHIVVRTPNGNDYGKDLLRQHCEQSHF